MSGIAPELSGVDELRRRLHTGSGRGRKLRGLLALLGPYRGRTALMLLSLVIGTGAALAPPPLAKAAIDDGIIPGDVGALTLVVVLFVISALLAWGGMWLQTYMVGWIGQRVLQDLRVELFAHLQRLSLGFYSRRPTGVIVSRLSNDIEALDQLVTDGVATLFSATLTLVGTLAILFVLDAQLALVTCIAIPVLLLASFAFRLASADAYRLTRERIAAITGDLQETISGMRTVRLFATEARHMARFGRLNRANRDANMTTVYLNAAYFPGVEGLSAAMTVVILLVGGHQAIDGEVSIGVLVAFVAALNGFFDPIQQLSQLYTTYQSGMAALDKIFELLDETPDLPERADAPPLGRIRGDVTFEGVSFAYGGPDAIPALQDVTLHVPAGTSVALVGTTGAGKSTLAKLVSRFYDPTAGRVLVDGHDIRDVAASSLRSQMGIVPQEAFLFSGSVRENLAFGRPDATAADIDAAIAAVGADAFVGDLPDGLDTEIGERGVQLSAGQRQLLAFARALVADPRILVLDEATSNVDIHTEARIDRAMATLLAGRTSIVIAHRLSTTRQADRIVVLEHGRIVEEGTHEALMAGGGPYAELYRTWARSTPDGD